MPLKTGYELAIEYLLGNPAEAVQIDEVDMEKMEKLEVGDDWSDPGLCIHYTRVAIADLKRVHGFSKAREIVADILLEEKPRVIDHERKAG